MSNSIDTIYQKEALDQIINVLNGMKDIRSEMIEISKQSKTLSKDLSNVKTPSGLSNNASANAQLIADMQKQSAELAKLQKQVESLTAVRVKANQKTSEEIINQRILATNANRQATATSNLAGAYRNLSAQVAIASEKYQNLIVRGKTAEQTQKQFNRELATAQREFRGLQNRVLEADKAVDKWGRTGERSIGFAKNLLSAFGVVGGVTAIATITKDIFNQIKEMQSLDLALKSVTGTSEKYYESQVFLNQIAKKYGLEINELTTSFTQFYVSAKNKMASNEIKQVFEDLSRSGSALGLSNDNLKRSFTSVNQMLSKGVVASEELRGQLAEAMPGAVQAMTKAVQILHPEIKNLTEKGLFEMIKAGKILASEVLPETAAQLVILTGADKAEKIETLVKSTNRLGNSWKGFIRSLEEGDGVISKTLINLINLLTKAADAYTWLNNSRAENMKVNYDNRQEEARLEALKSYANQSKGQRELIAKQAKEYSEKQLALLYKDNEALQKQGKIIADVLNKQKGAFNDKDLKAGNTPEKLADINKRILAHNYGIAELKGALAAAEGFLKSEAKTTEVASLTADQIKTEEDRLKQLYENAKKELEIQIYKQEKIYSNEEIDYRVRLKALEEYNSLKGELVQLDYNEEVRLAKGNDLKIVGADLDKKFQLIKNLEDYTDKKEKLEIDSVNKLNEANVKEIKTTDLLAEAKKNAGKEMDDYTKKLKDQEEALKKLQSMTDDYIKSFSSGFLSNAGLGSLTTFLDGSFKAMLKSLDGTADEMRDKFALTFNAISEVAQEAYAFINQASQANYDEEYGRLEEQKNVSIAYAGESAEAKKQIEKDYEARKIEIANREAKAKKQSVLFNIVVDTAQAVVSALAKGSYVEAILFGAIGAAQYAAVSSKEIPRYFKGGKHGGGLAMINDAGGSDYVETAILPDGTARQYSGRNVITDLPAGTEIFTPEQMRAKLILPKFGSEKQVNNNAITDNQVSRIVSAIDNKQGFQLELSESGFKKWLVDSNNRTQQMNDRFEFKQKGV